MFNMNDIIYKKREGGELSRDGDKFTFLLRIMSRGAFRIIRQQHF